MTRCRFAQFHLIARGERTLELFGGRCECKPNGKRDWNQSGRKSSFVRRNAQRIPDQRRTVAAFRVSSDEPLPFVDIELHQAFVPHFQEERLTSFLIHDIGAFHDLVDFEWLFAERAQDLFSIIQHG
jgi:hypothetical protein